MRPIWPKNVTPPSTAYLMYVQRFDTVLPAGSSTGPDPTTGLYTLKRACRSDKSRMGGVVEIDYIRTPVELIARFGAKADPRLTPYTSLEFSSEFRLNKYASKELFWTFDSISLPALDECKHNLLLVHPVTL